MASTSKFGAIDEQFMIDEEALAEDTVQTPVSGVHRRSSEEGEQQTRVLPHGFDPRISAVRELYEQNDVDAALLVAASITAFGADFDASDDGANDADRANTSANETAGYTAIFSADDVLAKVSGLRGVPRVCASTDELRALPFDPRKGFLLSLMDGSWSVRELCDLSGIAEDEIICMLHELAEHGVIAFD